MNYKKGLAKKIICHWVRFITPSNFVTFSPLWTNFFPVSCIKIDLLRTMITSLSTTLWHLCVCWLIQCTRCSEYFVQLYEAWTWLVCMLACVRLCVTSQLSRANSKFWPWLTTKVANFRTVPVFVLLTWNWFVRTYFRTFEGLKTKLHWNSMASRQNKFSSGVRGRP